MFPDLVKPFSTRTRMCLVLCLLPLAPAQALGGVIWYEGDVFPEDFGFERVVHYDPERWIDNGWFFQEIGVGGGTGEPYSGDYDDYRWPLSSFAGSPSKMPSSSPSSILKALTSAVDTMSR